MSLLGLPRFCGSQSSTRSTINGLSNSVMPTTCRKRRGAAAEGQRLPFDNREKYFGESPRRHASSFCDISQRSGHSHYYTGLSFTLGGGRLCASLRAPSRQTPDVRAGRALCLSMVGLCIGGPRTPQRRPHLPMCPGFLHFRSGVHPGFGLPGWPGHGEFRLAGRRPTFQSADHTCDSSVPQVVDAWCRSR